MEQAYRTRRKVTVERTFEASVDEVWEMWTTREGLESWWAPEGFTVKIHKLDLIPGGELTCSSTAIEKEQIDFLKELGLPAAHEERLRYTEIDPPHHLAYRHLMDFIPGVDAYEVDVEVDLERGPVGTKMVITYEVLHDERWTEAAMNGWQSLLGNLAAALGRRHDRGGA